jgi:hypothetical protein
MTKKERSKRVGVVAFIYILVSAITFWILSGKAYALSPAFAVGIAVFNFLIGLQAIIIIIPLASVTLNKDVMDKYVLGVFKKYYRDESN